MAHTMVLDEAIRKMISDTNEVASQAGMYGAVTILIDCFGILTPRRGYFKERLEAEVYLDMMHEKQIKLGYPHICFINGHFYIGGNIDKLQRREEVTA